MKITVTVNAPKKNLVTLAHRAAAHSAGRTSLNRRAVWRAKRLADISPIPFARQLVHDSGLYAFALRVTGVRWTRHLTLGTWHLIPDTEHLTLDTWHLKLDTRHLTLDT
jgi:hypothetical protein